MVKHRRTLPFLDVTRRPFRRVIVVGRISIVLIR
jgi:hypothetical protein